MSVVTNSLSKDYPHPDDHTRQTTDTPGFKPFTKRKSQLLYLFPSDPVAVASDPQEVAFLALACLVASFLGEASPFPSGLVVPCLAVDALGLLVPASASCLEEHQDLAKNKQTNKQKLQQEGQSLEL